MTRAIIDKVNYFGLVISVACVMLIISLLGAGIVYTVNYIGG
jgi:hypothetical protein